jgi:hypothetical protein
MKLSLVMLWRIVLAHVLNNCYAKNCDADCGVA